MLTQASTFFLHFFAHRRIFSTNFRFTYVQSLYSSNLFIYYTSKARKRAWMQNWLLAIALFSPPFRNLRCWASRGRVFTRPSQAAASASFWIASRRSSFVERPFALVLSFHGLLVQAPRLCCSSFSRRLVLSAAVIALCDTNCSPPCTLFYDASSAFAETFETAKLVTPRMPGNTFAIWLRNVICNEMWEKQICHWNYAWQGTSGYRSHLGQRICVGGSASGKQSETRISSSPLHPQKKCETKVNFQYLL